MSEIAGVESSAPTPTAEIASQVIDSFEASTPERTPVETPSESAAPVERPQEAELSPAATFLVERGHKWGKRADGKTDLAFLPASTVAKMLDDYVGHHKSTWDGERGTLEQQNKEYLAALQEYRTAIAGDPKAYLSELAKFDARYQAFLEQQQAPTAPQPLQLPEPDAEWNGARTWSMEAFQKTIIPAIIQQARSEAKIEAENTLKPLREREEAERQRVETEKAQAARTEKHQRLLSEAQTWPLFGKFPEDGSLTPFQQEVFAALQADKSLDLTRAYLKVAAPRLSDRKQLIEEINTAPKAPTVGRTGHETPQVPKGVDTKSIAARTLARLESGS